MNKKKIEIAEQAAKDFLAAIVLMRENNALNYPHCKFRANAKRKSMDLTRALADMRKPE